jgi:hypothetical protein
MILDRHLVAAMAAGLSLIVAGPASAADQSRPTAVVTRDGDRWTAVLQLDRDAPVWGFTGSAQMREGQPQWRPAQWRVETPGVILDRLGSRDVLRAPDGGPVPRQVRLTLSPASANVAASYDPALVFSDGSVALFSGQFDVFPLASTEAAREMPEDLNGIDLGAEATRVTWRDAAGPVLFRGLRVPEVIAADAQTYVLFGNAGLEEHPTLATVVDPEIPGWIRETMTRYAPRVTAYYAGRLGGGPATRPTIMASWKGPTAGMTSMGGSVLPGLIVASFEGEDVVERTDALDAMARWFVGHESAHFWLGQTVRYEFARDMWITEGGADLMAIRAAKALDPAYDDRAEMQKEVDDCAALTVGRGVVSAASRGEHRAYYACGAVFAFAAEAAERRRSGGDCFDVLGPMLEANREDGVLSREDWLGHFQALAGAEARGIVDVLLDTGAAVPLDAISELFDRTGASYRREGDRLLLL